MCFSCCSSKKSNDYLLDNQASNSIKSAQELYEKGLDHKKKGYRQKIIGEIDKANLCFLKAAGMGLAVAQIEVGRAYLDKNTAQERVIGRKWIQKAADQNNAIARQYIDYLDKLPPDKPFSPVTVQSGDMIMFV
jgi:TPR repeat protein